MARYWKFLGVVLAVAILGVIMVAAAPSMKPDEGGSGLDPANIVNLGVVAVDAGNCHLEYVVPSSKTLLITDIMTTIEKFGGEITLSSSTGGILYHRGTTTNGPSHIINSSVSLVTPLVVASKATLCVKTFSDTNSIIVSGHLVDAP